MPAALIVAAVVAIVFCSAGTLAVANEDPGNARDFHKESKKGIR